MSNPTKQELIAFLRGEKPIGCVWFGENGENAGVYWWRKYLPILLEDSAPQSNDRKLAEFTNGVLAACNQLFITDDEARKAIEKFRSELQVKPQTHDAWRMYCESGAANKVILIGVDEAAECVDKHQIPIGATVKLLTDIGDGKSVYALSGWLATVKDHLPSGYYHIKLIDCSFKPNSVHTELRAESRQIEELLPDVGIWQLVQTEMLQRIHDNLRDYIERNGGFPHELAPNVSDLACALMAAPESDHTDANKILHGASELSIELERASNQLDEHKTTLLKVRTALSTELCGNESLVDAIRALKARVCNANAKIGSLEKANEWLPVTDEFPAVGDDYWLLTRNRIVLMGQRDCFMTG